MTPDASVRSRDNHAPYCEAEQGHKHDCAAATELARLRAFAEAVRDALSCIDECSDAADHVDDCFHCYAEQALERAK